MRRVSFVLTVLFAVVVLFQNCTQTKLETMSSLSEDSFSKSRDSQREYSDSDSYEEESDTAESRADYDRFNIDNDPPKKMPDANDTGSSVSSDSSDNSSLLDLLNDLKSVAIADSRIGANIYIDMKNGLPEKFSIGNISCLQDISVGSGLSAESLSLLDGLADPSSSISAALVKSSPLSIELEGYSDRRTLYINAMLLPESMYPDEIASLVDYECSGAFADGALRAVIGPMLSGVLAQFNN